MRFGRGPVPIDVARELVDEALVAASRRADPELRRAFEEEREAIQSIETIDIREKRLEALDRRWMERLQVAEALENALARQPRLDEIVSGCLLKLARAREDEQAFLFASEPAESSGVKPSLVLHVTVDTLLSPDTLEPLLMTTLARARQTS